MTTLTLDTTPDDDDAPCTACGARTGSCDVRTWLSGRACCTTCAGPHTHQDLVTHDPLDHLDRVDHDDHNHVDHDDHVELSEGTT